MHYTHIWSYDHAVASPGIADRSPHRHGCAGVRCTYQTCPHMAIGPHTWRFDHMICPHMAIGPHIWRFDHMICPYMVIRPYDVSIYGTPTMRLPREDVQKDLADVHRYMRCIIPIYGHMSMHYTHIWSYDHCPGKMCRRTWLMCIGPNSRSNSCASTCRCMTYDHIWPADHGTHPYMAI